MSVYSDAREAIRDALIEAGLEAFSTKPDTATPPLVFVTPADPYIDFEGAAFGVDIVHHQVTVVGDRGVNEVRADELDELIVKTLDVLEEAGYAVQRVLGPGRIQLDGQAYLAAPIEVVSEITREST